MIIAEQVYQEILEIPVQKREKLFTVIARQGFEKEFYSHDDVFDGIRQAPFTSKEAAEYLEVAEITVRRWKKNGKLMAKRVGRNLGAEAALGTANAALKQLLTGAREKDIQYVIVEGNYGLEDRTRIRKLEEK